METEDREWVEDFISMLLDMMDEKNRIDDDDVDKELREVLYFLERNDILKMDTTEKHIVDGRVWKNHYWLINHYKIEELVDEESDDNDTKINGSKSGIMDIYRRVPEQVWLR